MLWQVNDVSEALLINLGIGLSAFFLFSLMRPDRAFDRGFLGIIGILLLMNYLHWRLTMSLPVFIPGAAFVYQTIFLTLELLTILAGLTSFLIMMTVVDRSKEADAHGENFWSRPERPAVDVFICTYNEPLPILERAILCAREINYPNTRVWVCDDTRRDWLKDLCAELNVRYITRPDNKGAKAGNLNNALNHTKNITNAPFIMVLDADFCVQPDIVSRIVPMFDDPDIGLVQTPQYFYNPDPIQHNLYARRTLCDDQRSFFDILQPSKDGANAAFCVGTSFIVRREALEQVGGFPDGAICEDLNLSYQLYREGWVTRWLNERLSVGISAESIPEYLTQRTRWCLGTIQVGLLRNGPLFGSKYTTTLRAHYLQNLLCWICKPFILLVLTAPAVFLWMGVPVYDTELAPFLAAGLPCFIHLFMHGIWVSNGRGLPIMTEVVQSVTAIAIARTVVVGLTEPFGKPFKVTAKGVDRSRARAHWPLIRVFALIVIVTLAGLAAAVLSPNAATSATALERFNVLWASFAMLVSFLCILALIDRPRPAEELFDLNEATNAFLEDGTEVPVVMEQASTRHVLLRTPLPGAAVLSIPGVGEIAVVTSKGRTLELAPSEAQRRALIVKLYAHHTSGVADTGDLQTTLWSALKSAIGAESART